VAGADRDLEAASEVWLARLTAAPARHEFVDVLDLLARLTSRVTLRHSTTLGYSPGEIAAIEVETADDRTHATVTAAFFGLAGETSPLPLSFVEEADRDDEHGEIVRGLFDLFHHRLLGLMHTAITGLDYPHSFREDGSDPWTQAILALLGVSGRRSALPPALLLRLAPVLATGVRSPEMLAAGLRIVLDGLLGDAEVRCSPFTGDWMEIDRPEWSRLGGLNAAVGVSAVLGTMVMHRAGGARVHIGPLSGDAYRQFLPGGVAHARVLELRSAFIKAPVQLELVLEVLDMTFPPGRLGERRLGDDLWLARSGKAGLATEIRVPLAEEAAR
jgi:type VI secretion system protein ImpH